MRGDGSARAASAGSIRSSATPRDALSTTISSPREPRGQQRPQRERIRGGDQAVAQPARHTARAPERSRRPRPSRSGSSSTSAAATSAWSAAESAPSSRMVPATNTSRRLRRSARAVAIAARKRLRVGVVAVVEDGEPALPRAARPGRRGSRSCSERPRRGLAIEAQRLDHRPHPGRVVGLVQAARGQREASCPPNVMTGRAVRSELDPVGDEVGALERRRSEPPGPAAARPSPARAARCPRSASGTPSVSDSFSATTPASEPNPSRCPATALVTIVSDGSMISR